MAAAAASRETHISQIFFTTDRAYKLLKPVRMSFLDLTDREQRLAAARRELDLNQRIAPDVYLGLGDLHEHGELVDHLIVMRRMPDDRRLSDLLRSGADTDNHLRAVARTVAVFHAGLDPITDDETIATASATRDRWDDNFVNIERSVGPVIDPAAFDRARTLALRYVDANPALFASRIRGGFIRDGHGDLIADDIFCLDDGPRILDCLAFRDDFRIGDVLSDIAFLVMDVHRLAGAEPGRRLMRWYQEYADEHHPSSLAHHYVGYRAHVRAKVACLAHEQGVGDQVALARDYHALALHHLELSRGRLVLIGGAPGVGKSTLSSCLSDTFTIPTLVTDVIRKDLAGVAHDDHRPSRLGTGLYTPEMTDRVYRELLRQADVLLTSGESAILDASWSSAEHRRLAGELARRHDAELIQIECTLDADEVRRRISRRTSRGDDPSDATVAVAEQMAAGRDTWPEATRVSTEGTIDQVCARVRTIVDVHVDQPEGA
jgi:aminoglycoside phosphotransferase family enzyme/predicted kinase